MTPSSVDPAVVVQLEVQPSPAATVRIEPPSAWPEFAFARSLGIPRTALFLCVARSEGPLQAERHWHGLGCSAAADEHGRVHPVFRAPGKAPFGRIALPGLLFCGAGSLDLFFHSADHNHQRRRGKSAGGQQSAFSAADAAAFEIEPYAKRSV